MDSDNTIDDNINNIDNNNKMLFKALEILEELGLTKEFYKTF